MSIYIQQGYWKEYAIIPDILRQSLCSGLILSPKETPDEDIPNLIDTARQANSESFVFIDPQLHACTVSEPSIGNLESRSYFPAPPVQISVYSNEAWMSAASACVKWQSQFDVDAIVCPTITLSSVTNQSYSIALDILDEALATCDKLGTDKPIFASIVIQEPMMMDRSSLDQLLDELTLRKIDGVYLIILRSSTAYPAAVNPALVHNLMYFQYSLSEVNGLTCIHGYSDLISACVWPFSRSASATGWYFGLRQYSERRFAQAGPARSALPRYTSHHLLSVLKIVPHLHNIRDFDLGDFVFENLEYDQLLIESDLDADLWDRRRFTYQHLGSMAHVAAALSEAESLSDALDLLEHIILCALFNHHAIRQGALLLPVDARDRLAWSLLDGVRSFRDEMGL